MVKGSNSNPFDSGWSFFAQIASDAGKAAVAIIRHFYYGGSLDVCEIKVRLHSSCVRGTSFFVPCMERAWECSSLGNSRRRDSIEDTAAP